MFRKDKGDKAQEIDTSLLDNQADALSERLKGLNSPVASEVEALAEAEQAAARSNAAKGDGIDHFLKVTGKMLNGPHPRFTDD